MYAPGFCTGPAPAGWRGAAAVLLRDDDFELRQHLVEVELRLRFLRSGAGLASAAGASSRVIGAAVAARAALGAAIEQIDAERDGEAERQADDEAGHAREPAELRGAWSVCSPCHEAAVSASAWDQS